MKRREFTKMAGMGALAIQAFPTLAASPSREQKPAEKLNVPLGICNHSLRGLRPNATELIEFAIKYRLDSVQFNTLAPFESLEEDHLKKLKKMADKNDISIYVGIGSISESALSFTDRLGDARSLIEKGIKVAQIVDSPIVGVRIGNLDDRYTEGGIQPKVEETVKLMKSMRGPALDSGIKFAFENHAGDLRCSELLDLINETGTDICGAFFDPGNAIYALEDPIVAMEILGENILCSSSRDVMLWPTEDGAIFQWTAVGDGLIDFKYFTKYMSEKCPGVPIELETISNSPRPLNYLKPEFWNGFPDLPSSELVDFLKLVRRGHQIAVEEPPAGMSKKEFDIQNQKSEFLKSMEYLKTECGAGLKKK